MAKLNFKDKWVLVTGASSGLGREMALYLAVKEGANLVIAARREDRLQELKNKIEALGATQVKIIPADLGKKEDVENLYKQTVEAVDLYAVVNNAGVTFYGKADTSNLDRFEAIIDVNFKSLMMLTIKFLDYFKQKGSGAILNVTSEASLVPIPYQGVYSASKHAAQSFTEALHMENKDNDIVISSYAPGGIATEMLTLSGLDKKHPMDSPFNMDAAKCAKLAIRTFKKKKFHSVPGIANKITVFLVRLFPRKLVAAATELVYRPVKEKE